MAMSNREKAELARAVLHQVGNLVEFRDDMLDTDTYPALRNVTTQEIALQLTRWLQRLPGESWDNRLPFPAAVEKGYGR